MIVRRLLFALCLLLIPALASAHGPARGPNGGQMQDLAGGHVELVAKGPELVLYLFDAQNKPMPATGATATATVLAGGQQQTVALVAADGNALRGERQLRCDTRNEGRRVADATRTATAAGPIHPTGLTASGGASHRRAAIRTRTEEPMSGVEPEAHILVVDDDGAGPAADRAFLCGRMATA